MLHLTENLRLPQHHRVEPTCHAKRVRHCLVTRHRVAVWSERSLRHAMKPRQPRRYGRGSVPLEIDLGPVAGRQDRRFLRATGGYDIAQRVDQDLGCEDHSLPHVERRGSVVEANGEKRHGTLPAAWNHESTATHSSHARGIPSFAKSSSSIAVLL